MNRATGEYLAHPRGLSINGDTLQLSTIFKWFADDFGDDREAVLKWLAAYAHEESRAALAQWQGRVTYEYDWALNRP